MSKYPRREFLLLAGTFNPEKHDPVGMMMSEKLDGNRCWWDGGVTRGLRTETVPWASVANPKRPDEMKAKIKPFATGLWSRYGNPIQAPNWFIDALPDNVPLDGELYGGIGNFQLVQKAVRRDVPRDQDWVLQERMPNGIQFTAFAAPTYNQVFDSGLIKNTNMYRDIDRDRCLQFVSSQMGMYDDYYGGCRNFLQEIEYLDTLVAENNRSQLTCVKQTPVTSHAQVMDEAARVCSLGGEGVMLRDPDSVWFPKRRNFILKVKPRHDSEATIIGFVAGREGKTGQFLGKLGTLVVRWDGDEHTTFGTTNPIEFELGTGLTHADRELYEQTVEQAECRPGKLLEGVTKTPTFQIGDRVTFSYRELSDDGVPKEGAYMRIRNDV